MTEIKRYCQWRSGMHGRDLVERPDGEWMLYSDHEAEVARLTGRLVQADDDVCRLHRIGSLEELKRIAAECSERDYCSCAPCEMSYCVTERFVAQLEAQAARLAQAEELLRRCVTEGYSRAEINAFLAASGEPITTAASAPDTPGEAQVSP